MSQTVTKLHFAPARPREQGMLARLGRRIAAAWQDAATRRSLAALDARGLSDIGISRAQAEFEAERPVWTLIPDLHR